jgi:hypothetical protein
MKKIIVFSFLLISVGAFAQDDAVLDTARHPAITEIGKPDGKIAEMKMNKDGGTLVSGDGKLELIIPSGALSKKTTISIQPITNLMPNGNGQAYRLEPSGIRFQKPVQLVFHYDPEESEDSMQLLMGIAMQDDKGQWYGLNKFTVDTVAKTISGNINHFSIWAMFDKLKLTAAPRLKVKRSCQLNILGVDWRTPKQKEDYDKEWEKQYQERYFNDALSPLTSWKQPQTGIWRVNNIIKGNAEFGTLKFGKVDESKADANKYTAPDNVPDWNPVTISIDLVGASFKINDKTVQNLSLKTKILIYDNAYEVTMINRMEGSAGTLFGNVTYEDIGSFVVSLERGKAEIIEKKNRNLSDKLDYAGKCKIKLLNAGANYGTIHIKAVKSIKVIPPSPSQTYPIVVIVFDQVPVRLSDLEFTCPPIPPETEPTIDTNKSSNAMLDSFMKALPITIRFEAKEGEQVLPGAINNEDIYYKATVKQLKDD